MTAWTKFWRQDQLVFRATAGANTFDARCLVLSRDGWEPITGRGGFVAGRCDSCSRKIRLVVNVSAGSRRGAGWERHFEITARSVGKSDWATGIVQVVGWPAPASR